MLIFSCRWTFFHVFFSMKKLENRATSVNLVMESFRKKSCLILHVGLLTTLTLQRRTDETLLCQTADCVCCLTHFREFCVRKKYKNLASFNQLDQSCPILVLLNLSVGFGRA